MAEILLVEDEPDVASFVRRGLEEEGHSVTWLATGAGAIDRISGTCPDVLLLDRRLPDISGLEICRKARARWDALPILMLTAMDSVSDRVEGLRSGADDYLPKPFAFVELLARIEALLRRSRPDKEVSRLRSGELDLDLSGRSCRTESGEVDLTEREFQLLWYLMSHPRQVLSRQQIHHDVWGLDFDRGTNLINVYINYLRMKLRESGAGSPISTVRGVGYRFDADVEAS